MNNTQHPDQSDTNGFIDTSGKETLIGGHTLSFLEEKYGYPLHIYNESRIRKNLNAFKQVFTNYYPNGKICFALKACTHPFINNILVAEKMGSDVASENELICALQSGILPKNIILNGNCKENFLIKKAILNKILLAADSIEEFQEISRVAKLIKKTANVILRLSGFDIGNVTDSSIFTAGEWTKFGAHIDDIPAFIKSLDNYPFIRFLGFHCHIGSQIADVEPYLSVLGKMIEMAELLIDSGRECKIIDIGGGFPVSYVDKLDWNHFLFKVKSGYLHAEEGDKLHLYVWDNGTGGFAKEANGRINLEKWTGEKFYTPYPKEKMLEEIFNRDINVNGKLINTVQALKNMGKPAFIIEPGRSIVDDSAITLAKIGHVRKIAKLHNMITLEMGITNHGTAMLNIPINRYTIINDYNNSEAFPFETFVAGNLCFSGDMISKYKISLQRKPQRGDIILIHDTGAYNPNFFASNANLFPIPARIMICEKGKISVMRKKQSFKDIFLNK